MTSSCHVSVPELAWSIEPMSSEFGPTPTTLDLVRKPAKIRLRISQTWPDSDKTWTAWAGGTVLSHVSVLGQAITPACAHVFSAIRQA